MHTQLLLDSSHPDINNILQPDSSETEFLELYSRELLFKLHLERTKILSDNKAREHKLINKHTLYIMTNVLMNPNKTS